ncbi:hypothetical protein D5086_028543 [Populus alba]|uniref:Uncharacterized protein n=1 Tax=Populus alba TaxID=43335 RepID=A0ACC4AZ03_POPAL
MTGAAASCAGELCSSQASIHDNRLQEWDDVFLAVYALVFLLQIHKWNACLAMPNVWQALSSPQDSDDHRLLEIHIEQDIEKGPCVHLGLGPAVEGDVQ